MRRRKTAIFFLIFGIILSILAIVLNIGWIILNLREVAMLVLGVIFFALIITGLILNTIFLLREIRRNEQHDAFLNAVTHELKTPIAASKAMTALTSSYDLGARERRAMLTNLNQEDERPTQQRPFDRPARHIGPGPGQRAPPPRADDHL